MEDTLLIDAAERFVKGEMSAEERIYFEDLRKNNPELDQAVVEQIFFLGQLDNYSSSKNFKASLTEVEAKLTEEGFIVREQPQQSGKLVSLWSKYRKNIAVAASIAGIVSLCVATIVSGTSHKEQNIKPLVDKISQNETTTKRIESKLDALAAANGISVKAPIDSRFRATGFMIDAGNNYIVTNAHVVKEAPNNLIVENNKGDQFSAKAVYVNITNDIAIVKITDTAFKQLPALPYSIRRTGAELAEPIFMLGYPKQEVVYGEGYVSAKNGFRMDTVFCQLSTSANEGNSGSPVVTKNGEVIGIISASETNAEGVVFAIKSANIYQAVDSARKQKGNEDIKINAVPALKKLSREQQVSKIQPYVFMIKGN